MDEWELVSITLELLSLAKTHDDTEKFFFLHQIKHNIAMIVLNLENVFNFDRWDCSMLRYMRVRASVYTNCVSMSCAACGHNECQFNT